MGPQARAGTLVKPTFKTKERWHEEFFINPLACLSSHFCWVLNFVVLNFHPILQTCHKAKFRRIFPKPSFDMMRCLLRISSCREKWVSRNDLSWFGEDPSRSRSYLLILWLASLCSALKIAKNWCRSFEMDTPFTTNIFIAFTKWNSTCCWMRSVPQLKYQVATFGEESWWPKTR